MDDPSQLTGTMHVVCQRCGKEYNTKPTLPEYDGQLSHGTCPACHLLDMEDIRNQLIRIYGKAPPLPSTGT